MMLRGDFETDSADAFLAKVEELLAGGTPRIALCLRYVKYINSTALGAIMRARTKCQEAGGDLVITRPSRLSAEIVGKMGLDTVLLLFDDEDEAVDFLVDGGAAPAQARSNEATEDACTVMFSFDDERKELLPGKRHHGVAVLDSVNADGIVFHWNPEEHGCDAADAAAMFRLDGDIRLKLQVKLARKGFFEVHGRIRNTSHNQRGDLTVAALWTKISSRDQQALRRHGEELAYLRNQATPSSADTAT